MSAIEHPEEVYLHAQAISENKGPADSAVHIGALSTHLLHFFFSPCLRLIFHLSALKQHLQTGLPGSMQHHGST